MLPLPQVWTPGTCPHRGHSPVLPHWRGWRAEATPGHSTCMPKGSGHTVHPHSPRGMAGRSPRGHPPSHPGPPKVPGVAGPQPAARATAPEPPRMRAEQHALLSCVRTQLPGQRHGPTRPCSEHRAPGRSPRSHGLWVPGRAHLSLGPWVSAGRRAGGRGWRGVHPCHPLTPLCLLRPHLLPGQGRGWGGGGRRERGGKDIVAEADDVVELQRDVLLVRDAHLVHERLRETAG